MIVQRQAEDDGAVASDDQSSSQTNDIGFESPGRFPGGIARGLRAAQDVLEAAGVTDAKGAMAQHALEGWDVAYDMDPKEEPTDDVFRAAAALDRARQAAIAACCHGWEDSPSERDCVLNVSIR